MKSGTSRTEPSSAKIGPDSGPRGQKTGTLKTSTLQGRVVLGPRDAALLTDVALCRVLRRRQIQVLHFSSTPRCNSRLHQLVQAGCLVRTYPPVATHNGEALYQLGRAAIPTVVSALWSGGLETDAAEMVRHCRRGLPLFLAHALAVADCYVWLRGVLRGRPDWRLERWVPEPWCHDEYRVRTRETAALQGARPWRKVAFKPDGFFRLTRSGGPDMNAFLEADMGHASPARIMHKLGFYRDYWELGLFRAVYGEGDFRTLLVTTDAARLARLEALAATVPNVQVWLTTFDALSREGMQGRVWQVAGKPDLHVLLDGGA